MKLTTHQLRQIILEETSLVLDEAKLTKYDKKALSYINKLPKGVKMKCPKIGSISSGDDLVNWTLKNDTFPFVNTDGSDYDPFYEPMSKKDYKAKGFTKQQWMKKDNDWMVELDTTELPDGSNPIMVKDIRMPLLAQQAGCAILLYELICELSPDGLVSSRNAVSADAFRIYQVYKNERKATIKAIPTGDDFKVWSTGRHRTEKHKQFWDKKKYTKRTHPLMFRYKAMGTPVYNALNKAGRLYLV